MSSSPRKDRLIGPTLRPDDVAPASGIGPALPVELFHSKLVRDVTSSANENGDDEVVDLCTIGPLIPGQEFGDELRHLRSDADLTGSSKNVTSLSATGMKRDSWMTQLLPTSNSNLAVALKPRKFHQGSGPTEAGYDSSWFRIPGSGSNVVSDEAEAICEKHARSAADTKSNEAEYNARMSQIKTNAMYVHA
ncbi:hypothetical protein FGIG_12398 [Fasciola gigantica]|uniref:Uncharacterized protein n=1 Tax=Fasciola gigantica TaxID=46835 RepID=A0A504YY24_FASGI|nr:hypothetical protein FGIG_12398 [Fasciola gigantica]